MRTTIILISTLFVVTCSERGNRQKKTRIYEYEYQKLPEETTAITEYRSKYSGDTLVLRAYNDRKLSHIIKKVAGYFAEIAYDEGKPYRQDEEIIAGSVKTTISQKQ